jgi:putative glycosyltransferase (TIGR04372 family)
MPMFAFLDKPRLHQPVLLRMLRSLLCMLVYPVFRIFKIKLLNLDIYAIGHLVIEPETYIKEGALGTNVSGRPRYPVITAPENRAANPCLLEYWKDYFNIISSPIVCFFIYPLLARKRVTYDLLPYDHDPTDYQYRRIERAYLGRPAILQLKHGDKLKGEEVLRALKIPGNDWFVTLHCRESGYLHKSGRSTQSNFRNADIDSYLDAIHCIVERGGWVIRMGDPSMKPLTGMDRVVDYAHSDLKSDFMDLFLCASSRFMIGTSSGCSLLASVFGVPTIGTNLTPGVTSISSDRLDSIIITKLLYSRREHRLLRFDEIFGSKLAYFDHDYEFDREDLQLVDNTAEEIRDVTLQMFDILDGKSTDDAEEDQMQADYKALMRLPHPPLYRVGRSFLLKYAHLLYN